jgi:uncharacterized membrane protein
LPQKSALCQIHRAKLTRKVVNILKKCLVNRLERRERADRQKNCKKLQTYSVESKAVICNEGAKMRKPRVKWFLFVLALLAVVIGIPVIINESYKANSGYMTMWGAADALSYYGTILGALVAVATVVVTILFTYKQIQRDSFVKSEKEKWAKIEEIFAMALDTINPIRPMTEAMDTGMKNPGAAITTFQKYQMACKIAPDQLIAFLNVIWYFSSSVSLSVQRSA